MQEMQELQVWSLGREDPWSRKWKPTPVFLLGKFQGQRNLAGYSVGSQELDMTEQLDTLGMQLLGLEETPNSPKFYTILHSHQELMRVLACSISWTTIEMVSFLDFRHYNICGGISHYCFNFYSCCWASLHVLICHLYTFFDEVSVQTFSHFLLGCFLIVEF